MVEPRRPQLPHFSDKCGRPPLQREQWRLVRPATISTEPSWLDQVPFLSARPPLLTFVRRRTGADLPTRPRPRPDRYSTSPFAGTGFPARRIIPYLRYTAQPRSFSAGRFTPNVCVRPPPAALALLPSYFQSSFSRKTTSSTPAGMLSPAVVSTGGSQPPLDVHHRNSDPSRNIDTRISTSRTTLAESSYVPRSTRWNTPEYELPTFGAPPR